jgi:hypothetical protein
VMRRPLSLRFRSPTVAWLPVHCAMLASVLALSMQTARGQPVEPVAPLPPAPEPVHQAPSEAQLSAEESAELDAALAADAVANSERQSTGDVNDAPVSARSPTQSQSMNPDISLIADVAAAYFSERENLQAGAHDPARSGFNLQQLELAVGAAVDPYFRFDANLVFNLSEVEIEEAYATTLDLPWRLQARAGQFLTRFGRSNPSHLHSWDFVDQPFALSRIFGGEGNRGLGLELSWLSPLPWYVELVSSAIHASGEGTSRSFYAADDLVVDGFQDLQYVAAIKQFFPLSDDWSLAWGLSGAFGPNATGRNKRSEVYGTDVYLKWRPISYRSHQIVSLHAEWFYRRRHVPDATLQDANGFVAMTWRFAMRWGLAARYEFGSASVDQDFDRIADDLDPDWTESRHRVSANTSFWPTEFSRLRLQGSVDVPRWREHAVVAVVLALEVITGAHGAHVF